jgi:hypothetical protein
MIAVKIARGSIPDFLSQLSKGTEFPLDGEKRGV